MPQSALDDVDRRALIRQVSGVAVPEIVEADLRQPRTLDDAVKVVPLGGGRITDGLLRDRKI